MLCGRRRVILDATTPITIDMFHHRIKVMSQKLYIDLQWVFPLRWSKITASHIITAPVVFSLICYTHSSLQPYFLKSKAELMFVLHNPIQPIWESNKCVNNLDLNLQETCINTFTRSVQLSTHVTTWSKNVHYYGIRFSTKSLTN